MLSSAIRLSLAGIVCLTASPDPAFAQEPLAPGKTAAELFTRFASDLMTGVVVPYIVDQLPKPKAEPVQEQAAYPPPSTPMAAAPPPYDAPAPAPYEAPAPAPAAPPPPSAASATGSYTFNLEWTGLDGVYTGTLSMSGPTGVFRVRAPGGLTIDQDMEAVRFQSSIWLLGSNLRYAPGTTGPDSLEYYPDNFRLVEGPGGGWSIAETCDEQNEGRNCAPVRILSARPS